MADALRPLRPLVGLFRGWPFRVGEEIPHLIEVFDRLSRDWGWEMLAEPEPHRYKSRAELEARYRQVVEMPFYDAAISWQIGGRRNRSHPGVAGAGNWPSRNP